MKSPSFFERKSVQNWCWRLLILAVLILFGVDALMLHRHSYFSEHGGITAIDGHSLFYVGIGLVGVIILAAVATMLHRIFSVEDTYYTHDF